MFLFWNSAPGKKIVEEEKPKEKVEEIVEEEVEEELDDDDDVKDEITEDNYVDDDEEMEAPSREKEYQNSAVVLTNLPLGFNQVHPVRSVCIYSNFLLKKIPKFNKYSIKQNSSSNNFHRLLQ